MKAKPPNILLIVSDQLSALALAAYGCAFGKGETPNLDRILRRGIGMEKCYSPCPLCAPVRAAFWTGRHPHETGVLSNGGHFPNQTIGPETPTLGSIFRDAGYETVHFGKEHDSGSLHGFLREPIEETEVEEECEAWPVNYDTRRDRVTTEKVCQFLGRKSENGTPYLCVADMHNPHDICNWMSSNIGPHDDVPIPAELPPLPDNFSDADLETRPLPVQYICCAHNRSSQTHGWNETNFRHYLAAYHHYVRRLDAEVGKILDALEKRDDFAETFVILMADHGDAMTAHEQVTKHTSFYEETTRVPFFAFGPGIPATGKLLQEPLTSLLDLLPTLCDLAGVPSPPELWGRSLKPWLTGKAQGGSPHHCVTSEWHTEWGFTTEPGRMICTGRWKYMHYLEGDGEEFYDLENDPGETRNLAKDPAAKQELELHRKLLQKHLQATNDPYLSLSWEVAPRWRSQPSGRRNHQGLSAPEAAKKT